MNDLARELSHGDVAISSPTPRFMLFACYEDRPAARIQLAAPRDRDQRVHLVGAAQQPFPRLADAIEAFQIHWLPMTPRRRGPRDFGHRIP
ncbi:hypothetical protein [Glycomyces sp. YM15]|uniref:hypothetical protein n=1 Tax=Glycomyces sp. YM15 TaxID=2800446 RepID=UPI0019654D7B|nr:hypothetical protein [Glycomyces sp. YM15]